VTEAELQSEIVIVLGNHPKIAHVWVTTSGKLKGRGGHWMTIGFPGQSDIVGQLRDGRMLAIEVKLPNQQPTKEQQEFIDAVNYFNGLAGVARSVDDALRIIEERK
jgi:hypothetical protein